MEIGNPFSHIRRFLFRVLSVGPVPNHLAFILDGNRRYAKKWNLGEGKGLKAGFLALMTLLKYCYELGVKYVTIYAFSIDNFNRQPHEVEFVMDLMLEKVEGLLKEEGILNRYGVRVLFVGNLKLLHNPLRIAAEKAMESTANNNRIILLICVAYTSTDEIVHAAAKCCEEKSLEIQFDEAEKDIKVEDIERHLYMGAGPDVDIVVRTAGGTRLSNFLAWQSLNGLLYSDRDPIWDSYRIQREKKKGEVDEKKTTSASGPRLSNHKV